MERNIRRNIDLNEEYSIRDLDLNVEFNRRDLDLNVDYNESDQNLPTGWLHPCEDHQEAIIPDPFEVHASNSSNISDPSQTATYDSLNFSAPYAGPANSQPEQVLAGFGNVTIGPVSGTRHLCEEAIQVGIQRMIQLQMAAYSQASVLHSINSAGYMINSQVHGLSPLSFQHDQFTFANLEEYPFHEIVLGEPFVHVPIFHETPQVYQWSNIMSPSSVPASFWPAYAGTGSDSVTPCHSSRRILRRTMLGPQTGMGNSAYFAANIRSRIAANN